MGIPNENEELVRGVMAAFNRRDLEELLELVDPGIEFYAPLTARSVGRQSSYQGHDGIRQYFDDVGAVWSRARGDPAGVPFQR